MEENSKEFVVKGDGPCFLQTTAAHIFGDEDEGPQLARDLNTHQAEYRHIYEQKIIADFPMLVTIGISGETKQFATSTEYFNWLQESRKAAFMWRGFVDVIAMANMANMDIDIIVHENGSNPEITHFKPDFQFPWRQDDPMKPNDVLKKTQGKMTILNWKNIHYNLIVGPNHMLAQNGSLQFQKKQSQT